MQGRRFLILIIMFSGLIQFVSAQKPYFVDGYHGGVYGHYPLWVTGFMMDKLAAHPEWRIGLEIEPETWDSVKRNDPETYARFARMVKDKRIEFTNPSYAQPYSYNISGESLIRQFEYGMRKIASHFPSVTYTTYAVEEPCFTSNLPQLLKQFGFKYAVLKCPNTCWGGYTTAFGGELVNWVGPDGTSMLTVPRYASEAFEQNSTWQTTAWDNSKSFIQSAFDQGIMNPVGMCYQDAGWNNGPWLGHGEQIKNKSTYVTWTEYIEDVSTGESSEDWKFSQEDVLVNLMWGSQALQRIAQDVRKAENKLVVAEKMGAMAYVDNNFKPDVAEEDEAWRTLMLAQHHDSWIVPYNHLSNNQTWEQAVRSWTNATNQRADDMIFRATRSYSNNPSYDDNLGYVRVFNTIGSKRAEFVRVALPEGFPLSPVEMYTSRGEKCNSFIETDSQGIWLVFKPKEFDYGYTTYRLQKAKKQVDTKKQSVKFDDYGNCIIETDLYQIKFDKQKGGAISSLKAKKLNNKEFISEDSPYSFGEIAGHFYDEGKFFSTKDTTADITILENNSFFIKVKIEGFVDIHPVTQIITIANGQPRIDFELNVNWLKNVGIGEYKQEYSWTDNRRSYTDDRYKLKVMFPNNLQAGKLYKNAPFDVCESQLEDTFFGQWDQIKHNVILNWIDLVQQDEQYGIALFSDHTTSYIHGKDFPLSLTAQYSGLGLWGVDYKITQAMNMRYALIPHAGNWEEAHISLQNTFWNEPLIGVYGKDLKLEEHALVTCQDPGLEITAMKVEDDAVLLRLFNAAGLSSTQQITLGFPIESLEEVLLNGEKVREIEKVQRNGKHDFSVEIPRFGIKTIRIKKKNG